MQLLYRLIFHISLHVALASSWRYCYRLNILQKMYCFHQYLLLRLYNLVVVLVGSRLPDRYAMTLPMNIYGLTSAKAYVDSIWQKCAITYPLSKSSDSFSVIFCTLDGTGHRTLTRTLNRTLNLRDQPKGA